MAIEIIRKRDKTKIINRIWLVKVVNHIFLRIEIIEWVSSNNYHQIILLIIINIIIILIMKQIIIF